MRNMHADKRGRYIVENILDHQVIDVSNPHIVDIGLSSSHRADPRCIQGVIKYEVKWFGYNRKEDNSWEPEDNLE